MLFSRRAFLRSAALSAAALPFFNANTAFSVQGPVVNTPRGSLVGLTDGKVHRFLGVPSALPPYDAATRLRELEFVPAWNGLLEATKYGDIPLQNGPKDKPVLGGGDCMRLNIWTPAPGASKCPVMVYFPGGGSTNCNNNDPRFDGTSFARNGVVLVTANYRVNVDGFLQIPGVPANLGVRDMIAALLWVQDNIAAFGGDPDRVTVFGQSAGGTHITSVLASPLSAGLFQRAILQSPAALAQYNKEVSSKVTEQVCAFYGIKPTKAAIAALPFETLVTYPKFAGPKNNDLDWALMTEGNTACFKPYIDGEVLLQRPVDAIKAGSAKGVDIMVGSTEEEWRSYVVPNGGLDKINQGSIDFLIKTAALAPDLADIYRKNGRGQTLGDLFCSMRSDFIFRMPANKVLEAQAEAGGKAWAYSFGWKSPLDGGLMGAAHGCDLPFVFNTINAPESLRRIGENPPQALADTMHAAWVRFATDGTPGWTSFNLEKRPTMRFAENSAEVNDPWHSERLAMPLA